MATDTQAEAQRLVSISLSKMAQSRTLRTGISLHKSLLVATVLQKARFICMEEVFKLVQTTPVYANNNNNNSNNNNNNTSVSPVINGDQCYDFDDDDHLIGLTPEEAGIANQNTNMDGYSDINADGETSQNYSKHDLSSDYDKENLAPEAPTYFDLDKAPRDQCFRERSTTITSSSSSSYCKNLKRRRNVCESETEEAIQSILPKKTRMLSFDSDCEDSVFGDDPFLSDDPGEEVGPKSMDIDRITSLVSIFSFGGMSPSSSTPNLNESSSSASGNSSYGNLSRSSSTPDLCSAQAKENDSLQQRPFIAMTV
ncbi:hypothetical protein PGB90_010427 [Kerria lacca]